MSKKILLDAPNVGKLEKTFLNKAIDSGYVSTVGPFVSEFEERFAGRIGVKKAVSTQSGTAALHMALYEMGIGPGDEVIVPALTFVASVNPILYVGAKPVFVDVDPETWTMDPDEIEGLITKKTKAIIPVHLYGNPCNMTKISRISRKYGLRIVEDATESLGATFRGRHTGTFGDFGCFSFNGNKLITTGGGGMVVGRDVKSMEHIKFLINQAKDSRDSSYHPEIGFNFRMTNIESALGLAQLEKIDGFLVKKRDFNSLYRVELADLSFISFQEEYEGSHSACWFTCVSFAGKVDISKLQTELKKQGIPTRRVFTPITEFPPYKKYRKGSCGRSHDIYRRGLCLPSSALNSKDDVRHVSRVMKGLLT